MNIWANIAIGAAGGVAAGVVLTFLVRAWDTWRERRRRNGQIARIRRVVSYHRTWIFDAPDERRRHERYKDLLRAFEDVMQDIDTLKPSESSQIRDLMRAATPFGSAPAWYVSKFKGFESLEWLGLKPASRDHSIFSEINKI